MKKNRFFWATTIVVFISLIFAYMHYFFYADKKYIVMVEYEYWLSELIEELHELEGLMLNRQFITREFNQAIRNKIYKNNSKIAIGIPHINKLNNDYMYLKGDSISDMSSFIEVSSKEVISDIIMQANINDIFKNVENNFNVYCKICKVIQSDIKVKEKVLLNCQKIIEDKPIFTEKDYEFLHKKYCGNNIETMLDYEKKMTELLTLKKIFLDKESKYLSAIEISRADILSSAINSFKSKVITRTKRIHTTAF